MLIKALKQEQLIFAITAYVAKNLGQKFVESPMAALQLLYVQKKRYSIPLKLQTTLLSCLIFSGLQIRRTKYH